MKDDSVEKEVDENSIEERMSFIEAGLVRDKDGDFRIDVRIKPGTFDQFEMWGVTVSVLIRHIVDIVPFKPREGLLLIMMAIIANELRNPSVELGENRYEDDMFCDDSELN
jgi:hypothetical protein